MQELRLSLVTARANLRAVKDDYELIKAISEQDAIAKGLAGGKNAEERERSLIIALSTNRDYTSVLNRLRRAEVEVDRLDALLEGARDARRAEEWAIRAKLADALNGAGVQSDGETGAEFDDATDSWAAYAVAERVNGRPIEEDLGF